MRSMGLLLLAVLLLVIGLAVGVHGARLAHCQARGYPTFSADSSGQIACLTSEPPRLKICAPAIAKYGGCYEQ